MPDDIDPRTLDAHNYAEAIGTTVAAHAEGNARRALAAVETAYPGTLGDADPATVDLTEFSEDVESDGYARITDLLTDLLHLVHLAHPGDPDAVYRAIDEARTDYHHEYAQDGGR